MQHRKIMPRLGGRKLHHLIAPSLREHKVFIGRDLFFKWLRQQELLVEAKKAI